MLEFFLFLVKKLIFFFYYFKKKNKLLIFLKTFALNYFRIPIYFFSFYEKFKQIDLTEKDHLLIQSCRPKDIELVFFLCSLEEKIPNILGRIYKGIHIDILFRGFIFTFPSSFNGKQYIPGKKSVASIKTIEEMGSVPEWLDDLICEPDPKV